MSLRCQAGSRAGQEAAAGTSVSSGTDKFPTANVYGHTRESNTRRSGDSRRIAEREGAGVRRDYAVVPGTFLQRPHQAGVTAVALSKAGVTESCRGGVCWASVRACCVCFSCQEGSQRCVERRALLLLLLVYPTAVLLGRRWRARALSTSSMVLM